MILATEQIIASLIGALVLAIGVTTVSLIVLALIGAVVDVMDREESDQHLRF